MKGVYRCCAGLDVHRDTVSACVRRRVRGQAEAVIEEQVFGTFTQDLRRLRRWLKKHKAKQVAMESTGVYWIPVWNVLEGGFRLTLVNPATVRAMQGRKTNRIDARRIAEYLQYGLLRGAQRATALSGSLANATTPYLYLATYWPSGAVYQWHYGNNVWPVENYTKLLQPATNWSTYGNQGSTYMLYTQNNWNANATVGLQYQCHGAQVSWSNLTCLTQNYSYDNLNRLTSVVDTSGTGTNYSRTFQFDEFGNKRGRRRGIDRPRRLLESRVHHRDRSAGGCHVDR